MVLKFAMRFAGCMCAAVVVGCATAPSEPRGEPEAAATSAPASDSSPDAAVARWTGALVEGDIERLAKYVAPDARVAGLGAEDDWLTHLRTAKAHGWFENGRVDQTRLRVRQSGDTATAGPIEYRAAFGYADIDLTLHRRQGQWRIASMVWKQY